jgi:hypothetical protein
MRTSPLSNPENLEGSVCTSARSAASAIAWEVCGGRTSVRCRVMAGREGAAAPLPLFMASASCCTSGTEVLLLLVEAMIEVATCCSGAVDNRAAPCKCLGLPLPPTPPTPWAFALSRRSCSRLLLTAWAMRLHFKAG